jgi:signal transduction histidine kinase
MPAPAAHQPHSRLSPPGPDGDGKGSLPSPILPTLDAVLAALPDALVLCDRFLAPIRAGAAGEWLVETRGAWARHPVTAPVQAAVAAALDRGGPATLPFEVGDRRWEVRAAPLESGDVAAVVLVRPIDELHERRREVILRRAHDLKGPLHAIEGFAKILLTEKDWRLPPRQQQMLQHAADEAGRLRSLLERLLDLARSGGGESEESPAPFVPLDGVLPSILIGEAISRFAGIAELRRVHLRVEVHDESLVAMPADEVTTLIENLLVNAMSAVPSGGEVVVKIESPTNAKVRLTMVDTGPGIPETALDRIFEPHFRLAQGAAQHGDSTGLGLAICRALVQGRGGTITAANRPSGGAAFTVELPRVESCGAAWPQLHLAPVLSHSALAAARASLDQSTFAPWQTVRWVGGVLTVAVQMDLPSVDTVASKIAAGSQFACWREGQQRHLSN